jgi:hypothetical protein
MKSIIRVVVILVIIGLLGFLVWNSRETIDTSNRVHTSLYEGASSVWDPQLSILPFHPQDIDGQEVGLSTWLRAEWEAPIEEYNHFVLTITDPQTGWARSESGEHDRFSLDLSGLTADTEYAIVMQACIDRRCEEWMVSEKESYGTTPIEYWETQTNELGESEEVLLN